MRLLNIDQQLYMAFAFHRSQDLHLRGGGHHYCNQRTICDTKAMKYGTKSLEHRIGLITDTSNVIQNVIPDETGARNISMVISALHLWYTIRRCNRKSSVSTTCRLSCFPGNNIDGSQSLIELNCASAVTTVRL